MTLNPQTSSPLFLKKPNHLLASFSKIEGGLLTKKPFLIKSNSKLTSDSMSPTRVESKGLHFRIASENDMSPSPERRSNASPFFARTTSGSFFEDSNKKSAIKFGKVMQLQKITIEDKKEESRERYVTVRKYIRQMKGIGIFEDKEGRVLNRKRVLEESEKVIKLAENALSMMNIRIKHLPEPISDSAMTIYPIDERSELAQFYKQLLPEICEFHYALLAKLKILLLTVCGEVVLFSPAYSTILEQKMVNGMFVLKDLQSQEDVRDHWFRVVTSHFIKADPKIYDEWKEFLKSENSKVFIKKTDLKGEMEELFLTLRCVMRPECIMKTNLPRLQQKIRFLKRQLRIFEPVCFDEEWWDLKYNEDLFYKEEEEAK